MAVTEAIEKAKNRLETEDLDLDEIALLTGSFFSQNSRRSSVRLITKKIKDAEEEKKKPQIMPQFQPMTRRCKQKHFYLGCAAKSSNHGPGYYNSLHRVCFCFLLRLFDCLVC